MKYQYIVTLESDPELDDSGFYKENFECWLKRSLENLQDQQCEIKSYEVQEIPGTHTPVVSESKL